jgi:hypothetical protein
VQRAQLAQTEQTVSKVELVQQVVAVKLVSKEQPVVKGQLV